MAIVPIRVSYIGTTGGNVLLVAAQSSGDMLKVSMILTMTEKWIMQPTLIQSLGPV